MRKGGALTPIRFPLFFGFIPLLLLLSSQLRITNNPLNPGGNRVGTNISSISDSNLLQNNPLQTTDSLPEDGEWIRMGGPLGGLGYEPVIPP